LKRVIDSDQRQQSLPGQRGAIATDSRAMWTTSSAVSGTNLQVRVLHSFSRSYCNVIKTVHRIKAVGIHCDQLLYV